MTGRGGTGHPLRMPRQPRLDAPGALHHVMGRSIDGTKVFQEDTDRDDFVTRLAALGRERRLGACRRKNPRRAVTSSAHRSVRAV